MDIIKLQDALINLEEVSQSVSSSKSGATSIFVGTTRDNFQGKKVIHLEYEAYEPMAVSEIKKVCTKIREKWEVEHIAIVHRLGVVPVTESSIVIAISSAHRKESLEAVHFAIDELKATVPIWKKEFYLEDTEAIQSQSEFPGENSAWKANDECQWKNPQKPTSPSSNR